jgi:hypothetical protein
MTAASTSSISFQLFMETVAASIREGVEKPYVIIDNHKAHHSAQVQSLFESFFTVTYMPSYSC